MEARRIFKTTGLVLAAITLLLTAWAAPALAGPFPDVGDDYPYQSKVEALAASHIVEGFQDGSFGPNQFISRQQFAKMIVLTLALPVSDTSISAFTDVTNDPDSLYPYHYVAAAADNGITQGVDATTFAPLRNITIAQAITMVSRSAVALTDQPPPGVTSVFGAFDTVHAPWADRAQYAGLLDGLEWSATKDHPADPITRGEVAALLYNLISLRYASDSLQLLSITDEHLSSWQPLQANGVTTQHYAARVENRGNAVVELYATASGLNAQGSVLWDRGVLEFVPRVLAPGEAAYVGLENTVAPGGVATTTVRLTVHGLPVGSPDLRLPVTELGGRLDAHVGYAAAGEVTNDSGRDVSLIDVGVALYDSAGGLLGFQTAHLFDLEAGGSTPFIAALHAISPADAALVARLTGVAFADASTAGQVVP